MRTRYWFVKVPTGMWMAGVHRFTTKKQALEFVNDYEKSGESSMWLGGEKAVQNDDPRKARDQVMRDLHMVKVRGALGGTYWE
jgi:hypothetical protein